MATVRELANHRQGRNRTCARTMTEPTNEEADAEADRQLEAVRIALNSALEDSQWKHVHPVTVVQSLILLAIQLAVGSLGFL